MLNGKENAKINMDTGIIDEINKIDYPGQPKNGDITQIKAFGLNRDEKGQDWFSYYIGLDYLDDANTVPLYVSPKIDNLDYYKMMETCLKSSKTAHYMSQVYDIRINKPFIQPPMEQEQSNKFICLIMYHYLILLKELVKKPLVKSYTYKTENLKSKIKGKILLSEHIKKNISNKRYDKIMCGFDEYSTDCPANRLLNSAYIICRDYFKKTEGPFSGYDYIKSYFQGIGCITNTVELNKIKTNPLFLEYKDAIRIAKIIYRSKTQRENVQAKDSFIKIPPYIIDMSKLFELYVFVILKEAGLNIDYHKRGNYGEVDFLDYDEKIIIDTKYKKIYDGETQEYKIEDIRQISGYARDIELLKKLYGADNANWENIVPNCLIIYPDQKNGCENMPSHSSEFIKGDEYHRISQFNKFYKYGIKLPEWQ
jgi:5-methylcytosine-specific restriction enzyme subunit McrC